MTKKQKLYLQIAALILILIIFIRPMAAKLSDNLAKRKQLVQTAKQLEAKAATLNGIDAPLIDQRVRQMETVFPSIKPIVPLMASLSQLAGQNGLSFGGVSLSPGTLSQEKAAGGLSDLSFEFQVGGDFDKITQFMRGLENTAPLMKIESVGLTIKTNPIFNRLETVVTADIKVSAYYQLPPTSLGSIEKPVKLLSRNEEALLNQLVAFKTYPEILPLSPLGKENLFQ